MKQVRSHSFATPRANLWFHQHEIDVLLGRPAWWVALWMHLVLRSDFRTGRGVTGAGELINALTPDQPERGPRLWAPSDRDIRRALAAFEAARILSRDGIASGQRQAVVFLVAPRVGRGVPEKKRAAKLAGGATREKAGNSPPNSPTLPALNSSPYPLVDNQLSTAAAGPSDADRQRMLEVRARLAGGRKRAPKGA